MKPIGTNDGPARRQFLGKFLQHLVSVAPLRKACEPSAAADLVVRWDEVVEVLYEDCGVDAVFWPLQCDMGTVGYLPECPSFGWVDLLCTLAEALFEVGRADESQAMLDAALLEPGNEVRSSTRDRLHELKAKGRPKELVDQLTESQLAFLGALPAMGLEDVVNKSGYARSTVGSNSTKLQAMLLVEPDDRQGWRLTLRGTVALRESKPGRTDKA